MPQDLIVVGAGPVGLAAAIGARLRGLEVRVLEARHPALDKACGEGLMPGAVAALMNLGVSLDPEGCSPFVGVRWIEGLVQAEGLFPGPPGLGVRRLTLHQGLMSRATALGVELRWGETVTAVDPRGVVQTQNGAHEAKLVIAADGLHSPVRKLLGLSGGPGPQQRFGVRRHFQLRPWTDHVEVYWADQAEAYVTPVGPERVGVAILWSGSKAHFPELLSRFPALARRLEGAPFDSTVRGAGPLHQRVRGVLAGRVALLGDAAGYLDAITGEGLSLGFHGAQRLLDLYQSDALHRWPQAHAEMVRTPFWLIRMLLLVERIPPVRRAVIQALGQDPALFGRILAVNDGAPLASLRLGSALRLVMRATQHTLMSPWSSRVLPG